MSLQIAYLQDRFGESIENVNKQTPSATKNLDSKDTPRGDNSSTPDLTIYFVTYCDVNVISRFSSGKSLEHKRSFDRIARSNVKINTKPAYQIPKAQSQEVSSNTFQF